MPKVTASAPVLAGKSQEFHTAKDIPFDWWTLFQSSQLNAFIEKVLKANPSIESAQAALRQTQENVIAQQGFFYPTVGVSYSPARMKLAGNMGGNSPGVQGNGTIIQTYSNPAGPTTFNAPVYYNFHTAQLTVGYVPDVLGGNRRLIESAESQLNLQKFQLEATHITLASTAVAAALQEASLRAQIAVVRRIIDINQENLEIMREQFSFGFIAQIDVAAQEALLAQAEQSFAPLNRQLEQTRNLLRALAGNLPNEDVPETFDLPSLHLPQELPLSLPSKIVEQRPDVRAAEELLHLASAQYGIAIANKLPQFTITAAVGGMASTPDWMFKSGGGFFNLAGNIANTIFDGGALRAKSQAAEQALIQAGAQYRSTVITALQNVADTLHAIQSDADALKAAAASEQASKSVLDLTSKQFELGYASYQSLLTAEQGYQMAFLGLVLSQSNRLGDTAALYQALGGGWWNRNKTTASNRESLKNTSDATGETGK